MPSRIRAFIALLLLASLAPAATITFQRTASWSFTGSGRSAPDSSLSSGGGSADLSLTLNTLPAGATVLDAILNVTLLADFSVTPSDPGSGCLESGALQVTQLIETLACSQVSSANYIDTFNIDGAAPGYRSLNLNGPVPVAMDPTVIHPGGIVPVTIFDSASAAFTGWGDPSFIGQNPPVLAVSGDASATSSLTIDYLVSPEPRTTVALLLLSAIVLGWRFARRECPDGNGRNSRRIV